MHRTHGRSSCLVLSCLVLSCLVFYFISFYFILFYFILFYFISFHFILFYFISILFFSSDISQIGGSLHELLFSKSKQHESKRLRLTIVGRTKMLRDVALGLQYLHENTPPILHRDLTTKNILLDERV